MSNPIVYIPVASDSEEETEPESEEEYDETEEEDSEEEQEQQSEGLFSVTDSPRVLSENEGEKGGEGKFCSSAGEGGENSQGNEWNRGDIDGLFCPICREAWTTTADHHVCCLPCGHIFGSSCIRKWLQQRGSNEKCPQCNRKCTLKDVIKLFASRVVAIDGESQKRIQSLEAKCITLEKKTVASSIKEAEWRKKEAEWKKREALFVQERYHLKAKTSYLELLLDLQSRTLGHPPSNVGYRVPPLGQNLGSDFNGQGSFILQNELVVDGARLFDIDASSKIILITRRLQGLGLAHVLTKMSLVAPYMREDILLPSSTKSVRDMHISPSDSSMALFASLGKKLSVLSTKINQVTLSYDLPAPAWSCSWDLNSSHQLYAGLQNGAVLVFDMRQTARPLEFVKGLTSYPVHTIHSLHNPTLPSGVSVVLSASSAGICHWNFGGVDKTPFLVSETGNQGPCISLAYCPSTADIVTSFRPRIDNSNEMTSSQPLPTPALGQGVQGSHVHLKRVGSNDYQKLAVTCANVNDVRFPRSTVMNTENYGCLFASGDEHTSELVLHELPSFTVVQRLKSPKQPTFDVRYAHALDGGLLGCLSDGILQLYSNHHPLN